MKNHTLILGMLAAGSLAVPGRAWSQVSAADFNSLKETVLKLSQQVQDLAKTHDQDLKQHEADQQQIESLQHQLGETKTAITSITATTHTQLAEEMARLQAAYPPPTVGVNALHNFTMVGDAEVQFGKTDGSNSAFALADFAPIFLFRGSDNVLFEAGFDITLENGARPGGGSSTAVSLSFAQLDFLLNDYLTIVAGDMVLPLGTYSERAAGWLNKIPDDPMARDLLPGSGVGAQLRGAIPIGDYGQMLTYSIYGANGPSSGSPTSANAADLDLGGNVGDTPNWHANPSGGGRIGWFYPWKPHYDIELGLSGQTGEWSDSGNRSWSAAVLDASVHISPYFEVKGEYINTWVQTDDLGTIHPSGLWVQAGYKLAGLNLDLPGVNNLELVGRYDNLRDGQGAKRNRYTFGYVYYFSNTLLFEGDYELARGTDTHDAFVFQLSYGF